MVSMVFLWFSCGFPMVFNGFPMVYNGFPVVFNGFPVVFNGFRVVLNRETLREPSGALAPSSRRGGRFPEGS